MGSFFIMFVHGAKEDVCAMIIDITSSYQQSIRFRVFLLSGSLVKQDLTRQFARSSIESLNFSKQKTIAPIDIYWGLLNFKETTQWMGSQSDGMEFLTTLAKIRMTKPCSERRLLNVVHRRFKCLARYHIERKLCKYFEVCLQQSKRRRHNLF